ncbi:hypothetical protein [Methylocystis sp. S23]
MFLIAKTESKNIESFLRSIVTAHRDGTISEDEAVGDLFHALAAAARDNEAELYSFARIPIDERVKHYESCGLRT